MENQISAELENEIREAWNDVHKGHSFTPDSWKRILESKTTFGSMVRDFRLGYAAGYRKSEKLNAFRVRLIEDWIQESDITISESLAAYEASKK